MSRFLKDRQLREDIIDIATIEQRRREPGLSLGVILLTDGTNGDHE